MEISDYLRLLLRRLPMIILLGVVCAIGGLVSAAVQTPVYESSAQMFVAVRANSESATDLQQGNTFTTQRMTSYTKIASSPLVTEEVVEQLKLNLTPGQLADRIEAVSPVDTVLITLTVRDTNPRNAAVMANAAAEQMAQVIEDLEREPEDSASPVKVTITNPATPQASPVEPSFPKSTILGLLLGLMAGVIVAVVREVTDRTVRGKDTLEATAPNVPVLASIAVDRDGGRKSGDLPLRLHDNDPRAEAYRQLRTNLKFADVENPARSIIITSASPNEGKTTTAINLALVLAQGGSKVCLVDADMRRPSVAQALGLPGSVGLTTVLVGSVGLGEALQGVSGVKVLACGVLPPNPSELLGTENMRGVIHRLEEAFDHVVIDMPPLGPVTDAAVLSPFVDGTLLVVRSGKTRRDAVTGALDALESVKGRLLGLVLNMAKEASSGYGYYGYGGYGYSSIEPPDQAQPGKLSKAKRLVGRRE